MSSDGQYSYKVDRVPDGVMITEAAGVLQRVIVSMVALILVMTMNPLFLGLGAISLAVVWLGVKRTSVFRHDDAIVVSVCRGLAGMYLPISSMVLGPGPFQVLLDKSKHDPELFKVFDIILSNGKSSRSLSWCYSERVAERLKKELEEALVHMIPNGR